MWVNGAGPHPVFGEMQAFLASHFPRISALPQPSGSVWQQEGLQEERCLPLVLSGALGANLPSAPTVDFGGMDADVSVTW